MFKCLREDKTKDLVLKTLTLQEGSFHQSGFCHSPVVISAFCNMYVTVSQFGLLQ